MALNINFRGIRAEELLFKQNNIKIEKDAKLDLKPTFARKSKSVSTNANLHFITLEVKIESTPELLKPFDLKVALTGIFECAINDDKERKELLVSAEKIIYPYLRTSVNKLTSTAFINPIILPVVSNSLFKENNIDDTQSGTFS